jgi:hypothetical protein
LLADTGQPIRTAAAMSRPSWDRFGIDRKGVYEMDDDAMTPSQEFINLLVELKRPSLPEGQLL